MRLSVLILIRHLVSMPAKNKAAASSAVIPAGVSTPVSSAASAPAGATLVPEPLLDVGGLGGVRLDAEASASAEAQAIAVSNELARVARIAAEAQASAARMAAEGQAIAAANDLARSLRIAASIKTGIAAKLAERAALEKTEKAERDRLAALEKGERDRLMALEKANREALDESSEINAAIEAGIVEADRLLALQVQTANKAIKAKAAKVAKEAARAELARVEALHLAAADKTTSGESSDGVEIIPFVPPQSAHELAAIAKASAKPKVVLGTPTAEDIASLKAMVSQTELVKEYELLLRRNALLSGDVPFDPHLALATGWGLVFQRPFYSHTSPFPQRRERRPSTGPVVISLAARTREHLRAILVQRNRNRRGGTKTPVQVRLMRVRIF